MTTSTLNINAARLNRTLAELGRIGETPQGMMRLAYSPFDIQGREYVTGLMRQAGLEVRIDPAGNVIARKPGSDPSLPAIALGSHTDTVPNGGKYDGALGVLGAVEVARALAENAHTLRHPLELIIFTNEEGTRFHRWLLGSRAMAGLLEAEDYDAVDDEGVGIEQRLADIGGDLSRIDQARRYPGELAAYFELHIEQGPTLHQSGTSLGAVTGITGRFVFKVQVTGMANHAGTTPMPNRHDALAAASHLVLATQRLATVDEICRVATVGNLQVTPNAVNVVPGEVALGVEFRDVDTNSLSAAETTLRRSAAEIADANCVEISISQVEAARAVPMPARMQNIVAEAADQAGLQFQSLPSGAGHDAQSIAAITEAGMVFVPSVDGISHSPNEFTLPEDCANGAQALLNMLLLADSRM
ncbi:MAG: M20 family metallo-hydrolase [Chloroflexota bacterium]|nr:M20 family metallo-hydrolase [Chloroflexota bacterium]